MGAAAMPAAIGLTAAGGAYSAYQANEAGKASGSYYSYLAETARTNAKLALASGKSATEQIGYQEKEQDRQLQEGIRSTVGAQKAALVTGAGIGSKTGEQVVKDTLNKGNLDEMALRYNAALRTKNAKIGAESNAFNFDNQAFGNEMAGSNARAIGRTNATSSILATGGSVASMWYRSSPFGY